jgi:hypothetical protein
VNDADVAEVGGVIGATGKAKSKDKQGREREAGLRAKRHLFFLSGDLLTELEAPPLDDRWGRRELHPTNLWLSILQTKRVWFVLETE